MVEEADPTKTKTLHQKVAADARAWGFRKDLQHKELF